VPYEGIICRFDSCHGDKCIDVLNPNSRVYLCIMGASSNGRASVLHTEGGGSIPSVPTRGIAEHGLT
jgi:hypothetical protein